MTKKQATKKNLHSLIGKLEYASQVVFPVRAFLQNLRKELYGSSVDPIILNQSMKFDLLWLFQFLMYFNEISIYTMAFPPVSSIDVYTDASQFGYGAYCDKQCFSANFGTQHYLFHKEIVIKELYAVAVAVSTWAENWHGKCVRFFIDSIHAKAALMRKKDSCCWRMALVRYICICAVRYKFRFYVTWISSKGNCIADALSRAQFERFENLCAVYN